MSMFHVSDSSILTFLFKDISVEQVLIIPVSWFLKNFILMGNLFE